MISCHRRLERNQEREGVSNMEYLKNVVLKVSSLYETSVHISATCIAAIDHITTNPFVPILLSIEWYNTDLPRCSPEF